MSLLLEHGHPFAWRYPLWMVFDEAQIVTSRLNMQMASQISLIQMALSSIPNEMIKPAATKKAASQLTKVLKEMIGGS